MKKVEMDRKIKEEMEHIGKSFQKGDTQSILRYTYPAIRRIDLSKNPDMPAGITLHAAIERVKKNHPKFVPVFDTNYFKKSIENSL